MIFFVEDGLTAMRCLTAFETWINDHLSAWYSSTEPDASVYIKIHLLIERYYSFAKLYYKDNLVLTSRMILAMFELWMVLDQFTVALYPIAGEYGLLFAAEILEPLLLPDLGQLKRLARSEKYLESRSRQVRSSLPNLRKAIDENSLYVRLARSDRNMRIPKNRIREHAKAEQASLTDELRKLKSEQDELVKLAGQMEYTYFACRTGENCGLTADTVEPSKR